MSRMEANNRNRPVKAHRSRMEPSIESQPVNRDNRGSEPLSPVSSNSAEGKGSDMEFRCFFAVTDPESTLKLKGTKHSACLGTFPSVNRLKEHVWRAHSPTHNCPHCRGKTTKKPTKEFKALHARCQPDTTKTTRPLPTLISKTQADALESLNQHFNKPNDESIRCEKLWSALFPAQKFELARVMGSPKPAGTGGSQSCPVRENTPSPPPRQKDQRQPQTSTSIHRPQNATPPTSPTSTKRPVINSSADIQPKFPIINHPKGNYSTKPRTRSGASKDSGLGTEPPSEAGEVGALDQQPPQGERQKSPSNILRGIESRVNQRIPLTGYPRRVGFEDGDDEMVDDSTAAAEFAVRPNMSPPRYSPASSATYDSRSDHSDGTRSDIEMGQSSDEDEGIEEEVQENRRGPGISNYKVALQFINGRVADIAAGDGNFDSGLDSESDSDIYMY